MVMETHCSIVHGRWLFRDPINLSVRASDCYEEVDCGLWNVKWRKKCTLESRGM